jgi:hypothetical protein
MNYEIKLANRQVKMDANKAFRKWKNDGNSSIKTILKSMGYDEVSMYKFEKRVWTGMKCFTLMIDTYNLIVGKQTSLNISIKE